MLRIKSTAALTDEDDETHSALSEEQSGEPPRARQRLIIAANRLPISAIRKPDGKWGLNQSAGGLVSALSGWETTTRCSGSVGPACSSRRAPNATR